MSQQTKLWILLSFGASISITISLYGISKGTQEIGPFILFYQTIGAIAVSLAYNFYFCVQNYRKGDGRFWNDQNFIKNGKLKWINVLGFVCFSCIIFINQNLNNLTIWTAGLANINPGVVTVIWSANPIFQAIIDYWFFGERLKYNDYIGLICMVICSVLLSLQHEIMKALSSNTGSGDPMHSSEEEAKQQLETPLEPWVSVVCGLITPIFFTLHNLVTRWCCFEEHGICFDGTRISITSIFIVFSVVLVISLIYWSTELGHEFAQFDPHLLAYGTLSSVFRTVAMIWLIKALTIGPQAIVSAIVLTSNLFFVVIEAVRTLKVPNFIEFICIFLGFFGFFELVMPEYVEYLLCCMCCRAKKADKDSLRNSKSTKVNQRDDFDEIMLKD